MARLTPVALLNQPLAVLKGFLPQTLLWGKQAAGCGCTRDQGCDRSRFVIYRMKVTTLSAHDMGNL